jgi:glucose/arabinose dehydrogenase
MESFSLKLAYDTSSGSPATSEILMLKRLTLLAAITLLSVSHLSVAGPATPYAIDTVSEGLAFPWSLAWLPNGDMLLTQRGGELLRLRPDGAVKANISGVPAPFVKSQGGLFDVLVDANFATNQRIYLTLAAGPGHANATELYAATLKDNSLADLTLLHRVTPDKDTPVHYGGRLRQLANGDLLLTTGDGFDFREQAQDKFNQLGKTLRLTSNGQPAPGNPFADGTQGDPYVYTFGHRNPQGLAVDSISGAIWLTEHGPQGGDELNAITPANNYGWPAITYGLDYSGAYVSPLTKYPGFTQPVVQWTPSIAASGLAIYQGDKFPKWHGNLFSGALVEKSVRRIYPQGDGWAQEILFQELDERIRDVRVGPDGFLYLLTDSEQGRVLRVRPAVLATK